ncbi:PREDICTED: uncharacterized protein LOC107074041 [Polistes dominula]|uniref:Ribosome biogenesis protein NOP53 n=1 Tax=Polistes dominula TaxID=743375 RepID=A0ABM1JDK6_POLDO|nr:PREDICTED: uncharacterized protein LOC107074041 [Polistes dominula]
MDSIYGFYNQKASEKINIKEYFTEYSEITKPVCPNLLNSKDKENSSILKLMQVDISDEEMDLLEEYCSTDNLTVPEEMPKLEIELLQKSKLLKGTINITKDHNLKTLRNWNVIKKNKANYQFKYIIEKLISYKDVEITDNNTDNLITPYEDIFIDVRVYKPFMHSTNVMKNVNKHCKPILHHVIRVLGRQMLTDLRDKIGCMCDLTIPVEVSENPNQPLQPMAKDVYKSGFFYIEETFYNDFRDPTNIDYSSPIIEWAKARHLGPFSIDFMENIRIDSLTVRFGYPWLYMHQGSCEHIIVFSDARLAQPHDELHISEYPRIIRIKQEKTVYCYMCGTLAAQWITKEHDRVPHNPCFFCEICFKSYNYINGEKIGNFKAYRYPCDASIAKETLIFDEPDEQQYRRIKEENVELTENVDTYKKTRRVGKIKSVELHRDIFLLYTWSCKKFVKMIDVKTKKRKVSKKTKKSWRKHVDITDVDNFLEEERLEERLGGPVSQKSDKDLFVIDKGIATKDIKPVDKKQRRLALKNAEPKCFSMLKPHSLVPDPIVKRNRVRTPEERKHPILRRKELERKTKGILKLKEKQAKQDRALADLKRANRPKRDEFKEDIWNKEDPVLSKIDTEWMTSDTMRHTLSHMGLKKRKLPTSLLKKPSALPAIEAPHPGISYNPSYKDHQNLLNDIAQKELQLMKEEAHLNRVTTNMFKKISPSEKDKNTLKELAEGLPCKEDKEQSNSDNNNDDTDIDHDIKSVNPPVKNKKKTLVTRRKQKEQKILANKLAQAKLEKKKISDIYKLRLLQKQISIKEKKEQMLQKKRNELKKLKSKETKTLSRVKFEPAEPSFTLVEELTGNLRNIGRIGNLLKDRYKSLQQRNIVAPANLVVKRTKAKVKRYIKPDHKITLKE